LNKLGPSWSWLCGSWIYNYIVPICNQYLSPLMLWVWISIRARCTTLCDKVCQWLATCQWFSTVSSTNKTDRHDITEILLKVAFNTTNQTNKQWKTIDAIGCQTDLFLNNWCQLILIKICVKISSTGILSFLVKYYHYHSSLIVLNIAEKLLAGR